MDETWVSTEKLFSNEYVITNNNIAPLIENTSCGQHITMIGCISANGDKVRSSYILPHTLKCEKLIVENNLTKLKYWCNPSGFMNSTILCNWVREVLYPHIKEERGNSNAKALLIVDSHCTRNDPSFIALLKQHDIHLLVIPPHLTSLVQPLDVVVYSRYKQVFKTNNYSSNSIYTTLARSEDAYSVTFTRKIICAAWTHSCIFSKDKSSVFNRLGDNKLPECYKRRLIAEPRRVRTNGLMRH